MTVGFTYVSGLPPVYVPLTSIVLKFIFKGPKFLTVTSERVEIIPPIFSQVKRISFLLHFHSQRFASRLNSETHSINSHSFITDAHKLLWISLVKNVIQTYLFTYLEGFWCFRRFNYFFHSGDRLFQLSLGNSVSCLSWNNTLIQFVRTNLQS